MSHEALKTRPTPSESAGIDATLIDWRRFLNRHLHTWRDTASVENRTVLITGAGGSIGSALARRLMHQPETRLLLVDSSATRLKALAQHDSKRNYSGPNAEFLLCDISDTAKLRDVFSSFRPDLVFHTAAMKHLVPLETDPFRALDINVFGTAHLIDLAASWGTRSFVNVSTDKAVRPTSVLGVSKRIAERLVMTAASQEGCWISVRLGNVLGSSGSVVPLFLDALNERLPLQITHPDAARYFITLEETASVLLNCSELHESSVLLPDMGNEKRILDLGHFLMELLSVKTGITYSSLRDGEKCREALTHDFEYLESTSMPGISRVAGNRMDPDFPSSLARLREVISDRRKDLLIDALTSLEPEFRPSPTLLRYVTTGKPSGMP